MVDPITIWTIINTILLIVSTTYSIVQAQKMRQKARAAAEARKGFEVPVEGTAGELPIAYGRCKIGGFRVYHNTASDFYYVAPNSNKAFLSGIPTALGQNLVIKVFDPTPSPNSTQVTVGSVYGPTYEWDQQWTNQQGGG